MVAKLKPDLFAFVAGMAVERGDPIPITCNCGGVITIMPPLQEVLVVCARCESCIKLLVLEGDPGYVMGSDPNGEPRLIPVQGSSREKLDISDEQRAKALEDVRKRFKDSKKGSTGGVNE
ncbi:MAG: hypothetical protein LAO78_12645 [Acidobacteriia bacterium]|nr:hypothetical protein [Terriglobia bacterium]